MKIILFLNKDLEANIAYNLLKSELLNHNVKIYYSDSVGNPINKPSDLIKMEYFEKHFVFDELLEFINRNQIDHSFEFFNDEFFSFPFEKSPNVNSSEFISEMMEFNPDLFISIRFGKIFRDEILQVPKKGVINLHSAVLPDYRGIMGTLHAIIEGNNKIGCTLHTIPNSGIDTGEIIEIAEIDVDREKSLFWNIIQLYSIGAELIIKNLKLIDSGILLKTQEQNLKEGNYFSVPTKADFEQIEALEIEIIIVEDYLDVITEYILKNLSEAEKHLLMTYIKTSF